MKNALIIGSLILLAGCATPSATPGETAQLAYNFCKLTYQPGGMNSHILLTPSLSETVTKAQNRNDMIALGHPNDKPPLGDGIPYQSRPDAAPLCDPGNAFKAPSGETLVEIHRAWPKDGNKKQCCCKKKGWTDRLVVKRVDGLLKIDDVLYGPDYRTGLREALKKAF